MASQARTSCCSVAMTAILWPKARRML